MRNGFLLAGLLLGCTAGFAQAQSVLGPPTRQDPTPAPTLPAPESKETVPPSLTDDRPLAGFFVSPGSGSRVWASAEYLLWWVKDGPLSAPLVTTGSPNDPIQGALGQPNTRVLFGGSGLDYGAFSGGRFTLGGWLSTDAIVGVEASGFFLEQKTVRFNAASDAGGNPPLFFPYFSALANAERSITIASPGSATVPAFSGNVAISSASRLWGSEVNGVILGWSSPRFEMVFLAGFRYLDLQENLDIDNTTSAIGLDRTDILHDGFDTHNQFYGGQLGTRFSFQRDRLSLDVTAKVALGSTHEVVNVNGGIAQFGANAPSPGAFPGGLYTQPTNIGTQARDQFGVLPEVQVKLGYDLTSRLRAFVSYDFLYWNDVVRPGNQIDRSLNLTQSNVFATDAGVTPGLVGPSRPAPQFSRSDFWAQGVTFGVEYRY